MGVSFTCEIRKNVKKIWLLNWKIAYNLKLYHVYTRNLNILLYKYIYTYQACHRSRFFVITITIPIKSTLKLNVFSRTVEFMKENMNCYPADETPTILPELLHADFCSSRSKVEIRSSIACSFSSSTIQESLNRGWRKAASLNSSSENMSPNLLFTPDRSPLISGFSMFDSLIRLKSF